MQAKDNGLIIHKVLGTALILFPVLFVLVFVMHFGHASDFLHFQLHYTPRSPEKVVTTLVRAQNRWPMARDPHLLGYLAMPLVPLCSFALYVAGRRKRPLASAIAMFITVTGTIYMGGVFAIWTALYRGLGLVDPSQTEGAIATFKAVTTNQGPFWLTTALAKLTMIGIAVQAVVLSGSIRRWAIACIVAGSLLFLLFWDLDNWMMIGTFLILAGFIPLRELLLTDQQAQDPLT